MTPEEQEKFDLAERDRIRQQMHMEPQSELIWGENPEGCIIHARTPMKRPNWFRRFWMWALLGMHWRKL